MSRIFILILSVFITGITAEATQGKVSSMEEEQLAPKYLYKVISKEDWQKSIESGYVMPSSLDQAFIHLAKEDQISHVTEKFWKNKDYLVLTLLTEKLNGKLVYETNPGGSAKYYHLYNGNIPLDAVIKTTAK